MLFYFYYFKVTDILDERNIGEQKEYLIRWNNNKDTDFWIKENEVDNDLLQVVFFFITF